MTNLTFRTPVPQGVFPVFAGGNIPECPAGTRLLTWIFWLEKNAEGKLLTQMSAHPFIPARKICCSFIGEKLHRTVLKCNPLINKMQVYYLNASLALCRGGLFRLPVISSLKEMLSQ